MTKQEELLQAVKNLDDDSTELVLSLVYKLINADEPDNWEKEVIRKYKAGEYKEEEFITADELYKELGISNEH